ncbi:universal stress protein [Phaeovibrio sulfidiphilus]|uniref:Universal stress protein n=1 Tax=Phaeovibrio sulfidiphilus TaxID=1220600 RepID=A0A8J6YZ58_9PROT|nr:universal stress protein [Phaeovibrio sulfidiphilus]MBE1237238.1 universal stress protein [Phaeovibrio sulfidiphilus]
MTSTDNRPTSPGDTPAPDCARCGPSPRTFLVLVDDSEEMHAALAYACLRARIADGQVALLRVIEPPAIQSFAFIRKAFERETLEEAGQLLQRMAGEVNRRSGHIPVLYVREGDTAEELVSLIRDEPAISVLVLAVGTGKRGPGPLVSAISQGLSTRLGVPVTLVPGTLSDEDIERMG